MFALEYYRFNKERVIKSEDAAYILSFAIMMLHTSLHNPSVKSRTTKKQWVSMNRGEEGGEGGGGEGGGGVGKLSPFLCKPESFATLITWGIDTIFSRFAHHPPEIVASV